VIEYGEFYAFAKLMANWQILSFNNSPNRWHYVKLMRGNSGIQYPERIGALSAHTPVTDSENSLLPAKKILPGRETDLKKGC